MEQAKQNCPLCVGDGGALIWQDSKLRLIHTPEPGLPVFFRVVWNKHIAEWSDLKPVDRTYCIDIVTKVESVIRKTLNPDKINLASLGNMVPHLHWHIIARFAWDSHFPDAIWAKPNREINPDKITAIESNLPTLRQNLLVTLNSDV